jgi:hypothetical protein
MTDNNYADDDGVYAQNNNRDIVDLALDLHILQEYVDPTRGCWNRLTSLGRLAK